MMNKTPLLVLLAITIALGACVGSAEPTLLPGPEMDPSGVATAVVSTSTPTTTPAPEIPEGAREIVAAAALDLARRQDVPVEQIQLVDIQPTEWPDAGLGCPMEGYEYTQVITLGYEIKLSVEGTLYTYHTDQGDFLVLCLDDGQDGMPVIPILPDERIMDGIPWMPVDPPSDNNSGDDIADPAPIQ
jgi:hypothetical protein